MLGILRNSQTAWSAHPHPSIPALHKNSSIAIPIHTALDERLAYQTKYQIINEGLTFSRTRPIVQDTGPNCYEGDESPIQIGRTYSACWLQNS
jgi:hypothetical protein